MLSTLETVLECDRITVLSYSVPSHENFVDVEQRRYCTSTKNISYLMMYLLWFL